MPSAPFSFSVPDTPTTATFSTRASARRAIAASRSTSTARHVTSRRVTHVGKRNFRVAWQPDVTVHCHECPVCCGAPVCFIQIPCDAQSTGL